MDAKVLKIASEVKEKISAKYKIVDFRIFGSTDRGHQDRENSRIDPEEAWLERTVSETH